jgi:hypothetical protein
VISVATIEACLDRLYIAAEGASLRDEERKKARELAPLMDELVRALPLRAPFTLVDACAGKAPVGLVAAATVLASREGRIIVIEGHAGRARAAAEAARKVATARLKIDVIHARIEDAVPGARPDCVVALHACGAATDQLIALAPAWQTRRLLLVPCCVANELPAVARARAVAERMGVDHYGELRRRLVEAHVMAERTLALEGMGYQTKLVALCSPTVTPHNLILRAQFRVLGRRAEKARAKLAELQA